MTRSVKEHYDLHLGDFYSWMAGDFNVLRQQQQAYFEKHGITTREMVHVVDLGAGHGIQSISLANLGFAVTAIDFNTQLLSELKENAQNRQITFVEDDIKMYTCMHFLLLPVLYAQAIH